MGYITILSSTIETSYFKLENGTIIKAFVYLDNIQKDPNSPDGYAIDASLSSNCYVPLEQLSPKRDKHTKIESHHMLSEYLSFLLCLSLNRELHSSILCMSSHVDIFPLGFSFCISTIVCPNNIIC